MNFNKIGIIISHEYSTRVKKKSFILITVLTPLLLALCFIIPSVIMLSGDHGEEAAKVMVIDRSGQIAHALESSQKAEYSLLDPSSSVETFKKAVLEEDNLALIEISDFNVNGDVEVSVYSRKALNITVKDDIRHQINARLRDIKLRKYDIEDLDSIMKDVNSDIRISTFTVSEDGSQKEDSFELKMALAYIASFLIYMFVFMFGNMVMRGVIEEKSSKVIEVLVSSVKSVELMVGKIIGVALVALTQFAMWVILLGGSVMLIGSLTDRSVAPVSDVAVTALQAADESIEPNEVSAVLNDVVTQVQGIDFGQLLICFLLYFIFGYLLFASMFAAIGAAVDNEADTQQLTLPVTLPLIIGLFIMLHTFQHPDSALSFWASIIPLTSPMVMMARVPFGVPFWELALSVALLIGTFVLLAYLSARIYRIGILTSGKKATFKELMKWMKYKN